MAENQINELEKLVRYHNQKYFVENSPEISDEEFDELTEKLRKLDPNSPALFEIIGEIGEIEHPTPMLSIDKKFSYEEIKKWIEDVNDTHYIIQPKYDGMAARFQNGQLVTRGNGYFGENISERLKHLKIIGDLPKDDSSVHGEIVIPHSYFDEKLAKEYKNPRNAAVGIVKSKKIKPAGIKALNENGVHLVLHDQAKKMEVSKSDLFNEEKWESILEEMFRSDYPLDGIVIKAISPAIRANLGATQHHQKWQVAYKSPADRKWTTVKQIKDQVGRTGRVTSVAVVEPVDLSGATITNVTLHNFEFVKSSKIGIGSKVEICRSGEVIPFITQVIPADKTQINREGSSEKETEYIPPEKCPICDTKLKISSKYAECPNKDCPARLSQSFEYFFKTLGVEELGLKTIEKFINEFRLNSIPDFYSLKKDSIANLPGFGEKSAQNITQNIRNTLSNSITPEQLLQAIGIKETGPATSRWIINQHGFENLNKLKVEDLLEVKGIGEVKAQHFIAEINEKWPIVQTLLNLGLKFKQRSKGNTLNGLKFAVTGKKVRYSRDELVEIIEQNGGEFKSNVTKDLDYLIAGDDAGSKLTKANEFGIKVINEAEFLGMVG